MSNSLSSGVSVTVSTDELESKIDAASGKFIKTLSKSQKSLKMSIDEMGRYVNASGKVVEGLSLAQIKLGQYVDEEGKLHTANGGFVEDLNKIEQALGFYVDEFGAVYNAQHEFIRLTADARKEIAANIAASEKAAKEAAASAEKKAREVAEAAAKEAKAKIEEERKFQAEVEKTKKLENEAREALQRAGGSASQMLGQFASLLATLESSDEEIGGFRSTLIQLAEAASAGIGTYTSLSSSVNAVSKVFPSLKAGLTSILQTAPATAAGLSGVGAAATTASVGMKALQLASGPVGIAIAAIGAGLTAFMTSGHKTASVNQKISDSFSEIEKKAELAGAKIRDLNDVLKYGAFSQEDNTLKAWDKRIQAADEKIKELEAKVQEAKASTSESATRYAAMGGAGSANAARNFAVAAAEQDVKKAQEERKALLAKYNDVAKGLIAKIREEQKTEEEKALALRGEYENLLSHAENQKEVDAINAKIASIDQKIAGIKEEELAQARKNAGIDRYLDAPKKELELTAEAYEKAREEWTQKAKELGLEQGQVEAALANYRKEIYDSAKNAIVSDLGVDLKDVAKKSLAERFELLQQAIDKEILSAEESAAARLQLQTEREKELESVADSIREAKSGADADRERAVALQKISDDLKARRISEKQNANLVAKVDQEYAATVASLREQKARELGVSFDEPIADDFKSKKAALDELKNNKTIDEPQYRNALKQLENQALAAIPGLSELQSATKVAATAQEKHAEIVKAINQAHKDDLIGDKKRRELLKKADKQLADAKSKEAAQAKASTRSRLGIDALMESLKSPLQKYQDAMKEIAAAAKSRSISKEERLALENKAAEDYWKVMRDSRTSEGKSSAEGKLSSSKTEIASSVSSGSAELYLSQVKNQTANYQSRIQQTTENLYKTSQEALYQSQQTNLYLQELLANSGAVGVWG